MELFDNLSYQGKKANFTRDQFETLTAMKNYPETSLDEGHISICLETGKRYRFSASNSKDATLGKWRLVVDAALDTTSENPVQNKLITNRFNGVDKTINDFKSDTAKNLEDLENRLNKTIGDLDNKYKDRTDELDKKIDQKESELNKKIDDNYKQLDEKIDQKDKEINDRITSEVGTLNETIDQKLGALDDKLQEQMSEMKEELEQKIKDVREECVNMMADLFQAFDEIYELDSLLLKVEDIMEIRELVQHKVDTVTNTYSTGSFGSLFIRVDEIRARCSFVEEVLEIEELMPRQDDGEEGSTYSTEMDRVLADIATIRERIRLIEKICDIVEFLPSTPEELMWARILELERNLEADTFMSSYTDIPEDLAEYQTRLQELKTVYDMTDLVEPDPSAPMTLEKIEEIIEHIQDSTDLP